MFKVGYVVVLYTCNQNCFMFLFGVDFKLSFLTQLIYFSETSSSKLFHLL